MKCKNCETEFDEGYICPACGMRNDEDKADKEKAAEVDCTTYKEIFNDSENIGTYCQYCGKKIERELKFCPHCGSEIIFNMQYGTNVKPERIPVQKKRKYPIVIVTMLIFVMLISGCLFFFKDNVSVSKEELIQMVQNGHLGNYDVVTIKEVLEYVYGDGEWNTGAAIDGKRNIVEYKDKDITIQFSVYLDEKEIFSVSGINAPGLDNSNLEAYDAKIYLDEIYQLYSDACPEKGLYIDRSTSNDTLKGHAGTDQSIEKAKDVIPHSDGLNKDLFAYLEYTEDELTAELGYEKNEYNCYPDDSHINFMFLDGKIYMIAINSPEDVGYTICGISLNSTLEEAEASLLNSGFIKQETYEMPRGSMILYTESNTGFSFSIETNQKDVITGLSYMLEKEDSIPEKEDFMMPENETLEIQNQDIRVEMLSGEYIREIGPYSYLSIWSADETGVLFAMGIGNSGFLAYRDMRDCNAKWISDTVAVYDEYDIRIILTFEANDTITVEEEGINGDMLSIAGLYRKVDSIDPYTCAFVVKDSDQRVLTENDLRNLGKMECKIARNEIYARHGRIFTDEQLQNYFDSCDWYRGVIPAEDFNLDLLSDIERENAELISVYEEKMGYK